jgi:hypothetical protein
MVSLTISDDITQTQLFQNLKNAKNELGITIQPTGFTREQLCGHIKN